MTEFEVPHRLRAFVRAREFSVILLAAVVGALAGVVVTLMSSGVDVLHSLFFGLSLGQRLSALTSLDPVLAMLVPTLGGLVLGVAYTFIAAWRPAREVDPIEANALHGGRMSLTGSVIVALQTIWSSGTLKAEKRDVERRECDATARVHQVAWHGRSRPERSRRRCR